MSDAREAWIVADLGFGDAGKGTTVDFLVRTRGARLVVRWNGGAQAGHTVMTDDGRAHTFAQFGAGSFVPGVRTHLAEPVVVHPTGLLVEADRLARAGVGDALARLTIAESARVVTPFHQAAGRLRELARGPERHGTCGVGIGETVRDALEHPDDAVRARDLAGDLDALRRKLRRARERLADALTAERRALARDSTAAPEARMLEGEGVELRWLEAISSLDARRIVVPDHALGAMLREGPVVLEGAQGVLLDEWRGFHPHTTWSTCTPDAARALLAAHGYDGVTRTLGVLRTYATRHGAGPLPTEAPELLPLLPEPHNGGGGWQGAFRVGWLDLVLARYAIAVSNGIDGLAVTHLDRLSAASPWRAAVHYATRDPAPFDADSAGRATSIRPGAPRDLAHQERLTRALREVEPVYTDTPSDPGAFVAWLEERLDAPAWVLSHGPTARDKRVSRAFPGC